MGKKRDAPDTEICPRGTSPSKPRPSLRSYALSSQDALPKNAKEPSKKTQPSTKKGKKVESSGRLKRKTGPSQIRKGAVKSSKRHTKGTELQERDQSTKEGRETGSDLQETDPINGPLEARGESNGETAGDEMAGGLSGGLRGVFDFTTGDDEKRRDLIWQKMVTEAMHMRSKLEEASARLRETEEKNKSLERIITDLRQKPSTALGSAITQDSFSDERSKTIMTQISLERLLCIGPATVCRSDDEISPFPTPFTFCHWSPLVFDPEKYISCLRKTFIRQMLMDETRAVAETFNAAFYQTKPVPGLKTVFSVKRRQTKSDRISKKVVKFLAKIPDVEISEGCEWRLGGAPSEDEGSAEELCSFFARQGSGDLFDTIFMRSPEYKNFESETRRILSITQLALMDSHFILKFNQKGQTERDFKEVAQGNDKDTLRIAEKLAETAFATMTDPSQMCKCCLLVDLDGPPSTTDPGVPKESCGEEASSDSDDDEVQNDDTVPNDGRIGMEEDSSEDGESDEDDDEELSYASNRPNND